ncbi:MAG: pyridoxal phosphate-dependent aminotransferase [Janthinobacterium lividum]
MLAQSLPGSLIREIANEAMGRPGLIALWFGESDLPTDPAICAHAVGSLAAGETFYSANLGIHALRDAIASYQRAHFAGTASADNIVVTVSGLNAILLTLSAIVDPGDEVVVLTPAWPNLAAIPTLLGASVRRVPIELKGDRFALDLNRLAAALTAKTRAVILNSPNNPTGWSIPADDLRALVDLLDERGIWLIADEVYSRLSFTGPSASALPYLDDRRRIIVVNSFSKTWAMTGWRLGWLTVPRGAAPVFEKLMEFNTSCAPVFAQRAGIAALERGEDFVAMQLNRLRAARAAVIAAFAGHNRITLPALDATFYAFPRIAGLSDGVTFARRAIAANGVGIAPGEAFGEEGCGHIRLCYARDPQVIADACARLAHFVDQAATG